MSHHAVFLPHFSEISQRIGVFRLVVDDDDVRQGQADRLFQARDAGTEEVGAIPRGDQDRHSVRVSCWNLSPCGQPPHSSDQPRAEGSQERDRFDQRPERGVKRLGRFQAAAEIAGLDGSGVNAPVSRAENVLENLDDLVGEPVAERQSKRRVRSQRHGGMERRQSRRFADLCRRFGRID